MTQRIFDIENEKDMADLWNILPEELTKIECFGIYNRYYIENDVVCTSNLIIINWHNKTEITRPIQEATEEDIGKLCYFWNTDTENYSKQIGLLTEIKEKTVFKYILADSVWYTHCRKLTKQEIKELI